MSTVFENIGFCLKLMKDKRKAFLGRGIIHIMLGILLPFAVAAVPQMVVLYSNGYRNDILYMIIAFVIITVFMQYMNLNCILKNNKYLMFFRCSLGSDLLQSVLKREIQYTESHEGKNQAETARRAIYEGNYVGVEIYLQALQEILLSFIGIVLEIIVLVSFSWKLAVCVFASSVLVLLFNRKQYKNIDSIQEQLGGKFASLRNLYGTSVDQKFRNDIWMYGFHTLFSEKFSMYKKAVYLLEKKSGNTFTKAEAFGLICTFIRDILVYSMLIYQISRNLIGTDVFIFVVLIIENCEKWIEDLIGNIQTVSSNNYLVSSLRNLFDSSEIPKSDAVAGQLTEQIDFKHVTFSYGGDLGDVLKDINISIARGKKIAITGLNGAGKSTLIKLLLGIYPPTTGEILWDGHNMNELNWDEYKNHFSVVSQNSELLPFSATENISGVLDAETDEMMLNSAIDKADLSNVVKKLPNKEKTVLTQYIDAEGISLSGGETQKVFMARAIYKNGDVFIFDEPTAALDPISEQKMYLYLADVVGDKTCIFISHRLISTRFCDQILFLENGRISETGTHDQLINNNGRYAELYNLQAKRYRVNES